MKVYQVIARRLDAYLNCQKASNTWAEKHKETIDNIMASAPSGYGIDSGTAFDDKLSKPDRLIFLTEYHHKYYRPQLDERGMYNGWTVHEIIVTPSLKFGFDIRVTGQDRNDIKDYLAEVYHEWLDSEAEE